MNKNWTLNFCVYVFFTFLSVAAVVNYAIAGLYMKPSLTLFLFTPSIIFSSTWLVVVSSFSVSYVMQENKED